MDFVSTDKLRGAENWVRWKWVTEGLLMEREGAYEVCTGGLVKPEPIAENAKQDVRNEHNKQLQMYDKANRMARGVFVRTLDTSICDLVTMCKTAREIWLKLHELFDQKNIQSQYAFQAQFTNFVRDPNDSMSQHIAKLEHLVSKMSDLEIKPNDFVIMCKLLDTLSSDCEPFKQAWSARPMELQTLSELQKLLVSEEQRRQSASLRQYENEVLISRGQKHSAELKVNKKKGFKCFYCGKKGHLKKDCFVRLNDKVKLSKTESDILVSEILNAENDESWIIDSGATHHVTYKYDWFQKFEKYVSPVPIRVGNKSTMEALGCGVITVEMSVYGKWNKCSLENVLYVPEAARNLFSVSAALDHGLTSTMSHDKCEFFKLKRVVAVGIRCNKLFKLVARVDKSVSGEVNLCNPESLQIWHERLGHQNKQHVRKILKAQNIQFNAEEKLCEMCVKGKQHKLTFQNRTQRGTAIGDVIHADLCGPMEEMSMGGARYFVCFTDDYSRFRSVFLLKQKSEVEKKFEEYVSFFKNQTKGSIKTVLTDGGLEFDNKLFKQHLEKVGIKFCKSIPYTPQQNGVAERTNRTLVELARTILISKNLPKSLWGEIVNTVVYILNRTGPTMIGNKTPYELFFGRTPRINQFRIIGTECFVHIPKQKRKKWDAKGKKGILVGYVDDVDGYRVWFPGTTSVERTRDVVFCSEIASTSTVVGIYPGNVADKEIVLEDSSDKDEKIEAIQVRKLRDSQCLRTPQRLIECMIAEDCEPANFSQAVSSEDASNWKVAMDEEMKSLAENNTWYLTKLPDGRKAISNRWVYRLKRGVDGTIERYKARLVVKGYSQKEGIDYQETFSPVARFDTIRVVLSIAASEGLELSQFDVKTAFLYGTLDEEIYMEQPEGYVDGSDSVCHLVKSLYGLKQSPRCWNQKFKQFLLKFGLTESSADSCLFYTVSEHDKMLLALYVDDGLVATSSKNLMSTFLSELRNEFQVTVKNAEYFLGLQIKRYENGSLFINQECYVNKILTRFNMADANIVSTPIEKCDSCKIHEFNIDTNIPYREAVGSLMYLAIATRPDISFAVSFVSKYLDKPEQKHWSMVKRILKYIKGTAAFGILYQSNYKPGVLEAYCDADFATDETRRSVSGAIFKYSGGAIVWLSKRQQSVSVSTTEAEYVAASEATKEIIWLQRLFREIAPLSNVPILYIDNNSAVRLTKNPEFHQRSKHIDVRYHFVRERYLQGDINVEHIAGENQIADIFTKALAKPRFARLRYMLGVNDNIK